MHASRPPDWSGHAWSIFRLQTSGLCPEHSPRTAGHS